MCQSVGSCLVYCNVCVQTSFTRLKRCWEEVPTPTKKESRLVYCTPLQLYNLFPFIVCCTSPSKVLFAFNRSVIPMQMRQKLTKHLKEKSTFVSFYAVQHISGVGFILLQQRVYCCGGFLQPSLTCISSKL